MFQPIPVFVGLRYSLAREHGFFVSFITWVSLLGVAVGVWALITVLSIMNGFETDLRTRLLSVSADAIVVHQEGDAITGWQGLMADLKGSPGLVGAAPYLDTDAMISRSPEMSGAVVRGVDPDLEPRVSGIADSLHGGKLEDLQPGSDRIVLGQILAYELQAEVGDSVTVMIPSGGDATAGGSTELVPRLRQFQVIGIFDVGVQEQDSALALVNLADAESLRGLAGPTGIRLKFDDVLNAPNLSRDIAARLPKGFEVRDWTQENAAYFRAIKIEKSMTGLLLMLIVAVAVFNIVATLVMVVNDKRTDIAILRTLGLSPRGVLVVFLTQGLIIGWIGTAAGVGLGVATALNVDVIVPFIEHLFHFHIMDPSVYYVDGIPSEMHPHDVVLIGLAALCLTFVATIYPALRAFKTAPAEALRYD
jgi:lipoprotein-releasing system permease protein